MGLFGSLRQVRTDVRCAQRQLRKNPGFSLLAVIVLALGIGANTAVFSVVDAVLFKPLSFHDADRLVSFTSFWPAKGTRAATVSLPDFMDWRAGSSTFSAMTYYRKSRRAVIVGDGAYFVQTTRTSPEFFTVFNVQPQLGRVFTPDEDAGNRSAVISHDFWSAQFAQRADVVGQTLRMDNQTMTIVGVLPAGFTYPDESALWYLTDAVKHEMEEPRTTIAWFTLARLKPGVTVDQAQAQLTPIAERLERLYPTSNANRRVVVGGLQDTLTVNARPTLLVLLAAVAVVLLIACANVATVLLAKAASRTSEVAIRAALGASRGRIVGQLLIENFVLALLAGCLGALIGSAGSSALRALGPQDLPRLSEAGFGTRVFLFTLGVSVCTTLLFGLVPAMQTARIDLNEILKRGSARTGVAGAAHLSRLLVVVEIALSVILVTGAGLLIRSFVALNAVDLGFRPERVLVVDLSVPADAGTGPMFYRELVADLSNTPGVVAVGASLGMPGHVASGGSYWIDHLPKNPTVDPFAGVFTVITPGVLNTLGIPIKRGRDFTVSDDVHAPKVALINESLAKKEFGTQDPIGRTIFAGYDMEGPMTIVGVVGDVRQYRPALPPIPEVLMPYEQHATASGTSLRVLIKTIGAPDALENVVQAKVRARSTSVPTRFSTIEQTLAEYAAPPRFRTMLVSSFGLLALCLAVAGVYGVLTYTVGQRTREIGLRMALGASKGAIVWMILREGALLTGVGMGLGIVGAVTLGRLLSSVLFQVKPYDPITYVGGLLSLSLITLVACYVPASRAAGIDPLKALRVE